MSKTTYTKFISTHTVPGGMVATKTVLPPAKGETEAERGKRIKAQAAANRIRVHDNGDGSYAVPSQQRDADGHRVGKYTVQKVNGAWTCTCKFHEYQNLLVCAHIAQVMAHEERDARATKRAGSSVVTEQMIQAARAKRAKRTEREEEE